MSRPIRVGSLPGPDDLDGVVADLAIHGEERDLQQPALCHEQPVELIVVHPTGDLCCESRAIRSEPQPHVGVDEEPQGHWSGFEGDSFLLHLNIRVDDAMMLKGGRPSPWTRTRSS